MSLPKHKYLLTYRYAEIIFDLENDFEKKFLSGIPHQRTRDQRHQAARSGKQCIAEGVGQSETSQKSEIQLLGVSKGSYEELLADNEDFLRQRKLSIWQKDDNRIKKLKDYVYHLSDLRNLSDLGHLLEKPVLPDDPEEAANLMLTLCHIETYLLKKQIDAAKQRFIERGGFTENLYKERVEFRRKNKSDK